MSPSSSFMHCTRSSPTSSSVYDPDSASRTVSVLRVPVFRAELNCLRDEKYFTDAVMSVCAALLAAGNQCRWLQKDVQRLYCFDALLYAQLRPVTPGGGTKLPYDWKRVAAYTENLHFRQYNKVMVPVVADGHWSLVAADPRSGEVRTLNSLAGTHAAVAREILCWLADVSRQAGVSMVWRQADAVQVPHQKDGFNCGPFVLCYLAFMAMGASPTRCSYERAVSYRSEIFNALRPLVASVTGADEEASHAAIGEAVSCLLRPVCNDLRVRAPTPAHIVASVDGTLQRHCTPRSMLSEEGRASGLPFGTQLARSPPCATKDGAPGREGPRVAPFLAEAATIRRDKRDAGLCSTSDDEESAGATHVSEGEEESGSRYEQSLQSTTEDESVTEEECSADSQGDSAENDDDLPVVVSPACAHLFAPQDAHAAKLAPLYADCESDPSAVPPPGSFAISSWGRTYSHNISPTFIGLCDHYAPKTAAHRAGGARPGDGTDALAVNVHTHFVGPVPAGYQVAHRAGWPANNCARNLHAVPPAINATEALPVPRMRTRSAVEGRLAGSTGTWAVHPSVCSAAYAVGRGHRTRTLIGKACFARQPTQEVAIAEGHEWRWAAWDVSIPGEELEDLRYSGYETDLKASRETGRFLRKADGVKLAVEVVGAPVSMELYDEEGDIVRRDICSASFLIMSNFGPPKPPGDDTLFVGRSAHPGLAVDLLQWVHPKQPFERSHRPNDHIFLIIEARHKGDKEWMKFSSRKAVGAWLGMGGPVQPSLPAPVMTAMRAGETVAVKNASAFVRFS